MIEEAGAAAHQADVDLPQKQLFNDILERNKALLSKK